MNQGTICAKVYPEGVQPVKGNNCGLIPAGMLERARKGKAVRGVGVGRAAGGQGWRYSRVMEYALTPGTDY